MDVCTPYIAAGVAIADDQAAIDAVLAGHGTVLDAAKAIAAETLAEHLLRSSPSEWTEAARMLDHELVWAHMVVPFL